MTNSRYVRRRSFGRFSRRSRLLAFLTERSETLDGTAAGTTFTATNAANTFTASGHGFGIADGPVVVSNAGGALPSGLVDGTEYFVGVVDANTFTLHINRQAVRDDDRVAISDDGTGTQTVARAETASGLLEWLRFGRAKPRRLAAVTDIDSLP